MINEAEKNKKTDLVTACEKGDLEWVERLLKAGADKFILDECGWITKIRKLIRKLIYNPI